MLKFIKFDSRCSAAPGPAGGSYGAPPDPLAVFQRAQGLLLKPKKGREGDGRRQVRGQ